MKNIAIIYFSSGGANQQMAEAIAHGAQSVPNTKVELISIKADQISGGRWESAEIMEKLSAADAIIFGTATYMGGPAAQFKAFADATGGVWYKRGWLNKLAGGFSVSGSPAGDKFSTLNYLMVLAMQHGMIWIGGGEVNSAQYGKTDEINRTGAQLGAFGQNIAAPGQPAKVHPADLKTAELYGARLATIANKVS
jgi:NAD(P)H dehydrogenase (quinone)